MNMLFLHDQNLPFLRYIHCNFCLNLLIIHGDMKENVSGCSFSEHSVVASLRTQYAQYDFWAINILCILAVVGYLQSKWKKWSYAV